MRMLRLLVPLAALLGVLLAPDAGPLAAQTGPLRVGDAVAAMSPARAGAPPRVSRAGEGAAATRPDAVVVEVAAPGTGGVVAARLPLPGRGSVRWQVRPGAGVRVFGMQEGVLSREAANAEGALAVTFGLPKDHPAGRMRLGEVRFWVDGSEHVVELVTTVAPRRALTIEIEMPDSVRPGDLVAAEFRVRNAGTAADTVALLLEVDRGWRVDAASARVALEGGEEHRGSFRVRVPDDAPMWAATGLRLTALGTGARAFAGRQMVTVPGRGAQARRMHLPMSVFLGASTPDIGVLSAGRSSFGLTASGEIGGGTFLDLRVQDNEVGPGVPALPGVRSNSVVRAQLRSASWNATLGDAGTSVGLLPRFFAAGRGAEAGWSGRAGDLRASLLFPRLGWGFDRSGRVLSGGGGLRTPVGRVGVSFLQVTRTGADAPIAGSGYSAALQYGLHTGSHRLQVEGGWMESTTASGHVEGGPAFEAAYLLTATRGSLSASARRAPETALLGGGVLEENSMGGTFALGSATTLHANAFSYRTTASEFAFFNELGEQRIRVEPSARGGSAGVLWSDRGYSAGLAARALDRRMAGAGELRRSMAVQAGRSFGRLGVNGTAELGERLPEAGEAADLRRFRGTVSWNGAAGSLWASAENSSEGPPLSVALNASLRVRAVAVETMLNTFRDTLSLPSTTFSSSVSVGIARATELRAGAEYRPWARDQVTPWAVSLGVRRTLGMPLPTRVRAQLAGLVFEDLNGNGVRDGGEPGLAGIPLAVGPALGTTDMQGRFWFADAPRGELVVSQRTLPTGSIVRPGATRRGESYLEIPVVRTGELRLRVRLDDGTSSDERAPGAGLRVRLEDVDGRGREAVTDSVGIAVFRALLPGAATVTVEGPPRRAGEGAGEPTVLQVQILPGEPVEAEAEVVYRRRPVRFQAGQRSP
jgi:hypothetical protein